MKEANKQRQVQIVRVQGYCMIRIAIGILTSFQALEEQQEVQRRHAQNRMVLENVLPSHVAKTIMEDRVKNDLYNEVSLVFAKHVSFRNF